MSRHEKGAIDQRTNRKGQCTNLFQQKTNGVMNLYQMDLTTTTFYHDQNTTLKTVSTCDQQIHGGGMQHYLCFLMPFFCGTDPFFFWLPPSTSASLKLDSDPPSQDSSESKPEEKRRLQLRPNWEQTLNHIVTEIFMTNKGISCICMLICSGLHRWLFKHMCTLFRHFVNTHHS